MKTRSKTLTAAIDIGIHGGMVEMEEEAVVSKESDDDALCGRFFNKYIFEDLSHK